MKQNIFSFLVITLVVIACNSTNTTEETVVATDSTVTIIEETPTVQTPKTANFPFLGATTLQGFQQDKKHEYGGGDCMGVVFNYTLGTTIIAVDSMSCGDYGFTTTRYFLEDGVVQMLHIARIDNTIPEFEETIVDLRSTPYKEYGSKGKMKQGDYSQAYTNQPIGGNLKQKETVSFTPDELKKEYQELFNRIVEDY